MFFPGGGGEGAGHQIFSPTFLCPAKKKCIFIKIIGFGEKEVKIKLCTPLMPVFASFIPTPQYIAMTNFYKVQIFNKELPLFPRFSSSGTCTFYPILSGSHYWCPEINQQKTFRKTHVFHQSSFSFFLSFLPAFILFTPCFSEAVFNHEFQPS